MDRPRITHIIRDPVHHVTYELLADRILTQWEVIRTVLQYQSRRKKRKIPERHKVVAIRTLYGRPAES